MSHKCTQEDLIRVINSKVDDLKIDVRAQHDDVRSLLKFKWQIMGGAGVLGALLGGLTYMISLVFPILFK